MQYALGVCGVRVDIRQPHDEFTTSLKFDVKMSLKVISHLFVIGVAVNASGGEDTGTKSLTEADKRTAMEATQGPHRLQPVDTHEGWLRSSHEMSLYETSPRLD